MPTATMTDLLQAIQTFLSSGTFPSFFMLRSNADDAAYEAYIFTLVLQAAQEAGCTVRLRSINYQTQPPPTFVFRGGPGYINSDRYDYGYAVCSYQNEDLFEVHVDVLHQGSSEAPHEVDISLLDPGEARQCRRIPPSRLVSPKAQKTYGIFECKFYKKGRLGTDLIRTFVGLADDMGSLQITRFVSSMNSPTIRQYCSGKKTRPRFTPQLTPLFAGNERQFIASLADVFRNWLALP